MGCGESKHDVASGNTVRNSSKRLSSKKSKDYETLPSEMPAAETGNENGVADGGKSLEKGNPKAESAAENFQGKENGKPNTISTEEKVKGDESEIVEANTKVDEKLKGVKKEVDEKMDINEEKKGGVVEEKGEEKLISHESPRKEEETTIEAVISEGISGKSEYYSPRGKDGAAVEKDVVVEEKGNDEEKKIETKSEVAKKVTVANPEKEEKVSATIVEEKVSPSTEELKVPGAKEETVTETSAKDSKTN